MSHSAPGRTAWERSERLTFRQKVFPRDVDAVRSLVQATAFFSEEETQLASQLVAERLRRGQESGYHFLFATDEANISPEHERTSMLGYACYGPIPCTVHSYDLYWLAVHPAWQGRGLGKQLLEAAELQIVQQGGRRIYVDTSGRSQYTPTRLFYQRCGYRQVAHLEDFYAPGDGKVIYLKEVPSPGR